MPRTKPDTSAEWQGGFGCTEPRDTLLVACTKETLPAIKAAQEFLSQGHESQVLEKHWMTGRIPLHYACYKGNLELVQLFLEQDLEKQLFETSNDKKLPLHLACESGALDLVKFLVNSSDGEKQIKHADMFGKNPLHIAAERGFPEIVKFLLESVSEPESMVVQAETKTQRIPLHGACLQRQADTVTALLEHKGKEQRLARDVDMGLPLHLACLRGCVETVKILLEEVPIEQVLARDVKEQNALYWACNSGVIEIVDLLLAHEPEKQVIDSESLSSIPLHCACRGGIPEIVQRLLKYKPRQQVLHEGILQPLDHEKEGEKGKGEIALHEACRSHSTEIVEALLQFDPEEQILTKNHMGLLPFQLICKYGIAEFLPLLLQYSPTNQLKTDSLLRDNVEQNEKWFDAVLNLFQSGILEEEHFKSVVPKSRRDRMRSLIVQLRASKSAKSVRSETVDPEL